MNMLKRLLITVCVLKIVSLTLLLIYNPDTKEINRFLKNELSRKYNEHSFEVSLIPGLSSEYKEISRDSIKYLIAQQSEPHWPKLERTWFQDYARYLRGLDTVWQKDAFINLKSYPKLLQNTVAEESAKREMFAHFENLPPRFRPFEDTKIIGLLSDINLYSDSLQLKLVPFGFEPHLAFDYCKCDSNTFLTKDNPFYYKGSLHNWKCTFQHPQTKEIQVYDLQSVK